MVSSAFLPGGNAIRRITARDYVLFYYRRLRHLPLGSLSARHVYVYVCYWQNVLGTHHASAHGGSFDLIIKMLD